MAEEALTLNMRARGSARTRRDVDNVGDSVDRVGKRAKRTNKNVNLFSKGLDLLGTRMVALTVLAVALTVVLGPPLLGALALLTAGAVALGGALGPVAVLAAAASARFNTMKDVAGSAAARLAAAFGDIQRVFARTTAGGADALLGGLAKSIRIVLPLLRAMRDPLTAVGTAASGAMQQAARGVAQLGPDLRTMLSAAAPVIRHMGEFVPALAYALIHLATAGMPVLAQVLEWLTQFSYWLGPAIDNTAAFARSAGFLSVVGQAWDAVASVAQYLAGVVASLARIFYELFMQSKSMLALVGGGLLVAFKAFATALQFVSRNMQIFGPILQLVIAGFVGLYVVRAVIGLFYLLKAALIMVKVAWVVLNTLMLTNPFVLVAALVVALAVAIWQLYKRSETFRNAVATLWELLKASPLGQMVQLTIRLGTALYKAVGGVQGVKNALQSGLTAAIDFVRPKVEWLVNAFNDVVNAAGKVKSAIDSLPGGGSGGVLGDALKAIPGGGGQLLGGLPGMADGGPVRAGAPYVVGERGPEVFRPAQRGVVEPNGGWAGPREVVVRAPIYLDGRQIAEGTARANLRKRASR